MLLTLSLTLVRSCWLWNSALSHNHAKPKFCMTWQTLLAWHCFLSQQINKFSIGMVSNADHTDAQLPKLFELLALLPHLKWVNKFNYFIVIKGDLIILIVKLVQYSIFNYQHSDWDSVKYYTLENVVTPKQYNIHWPPHSSTLQWGLLGPDITEQFQKRGLKIWVFLCKKCILRDHGNTKNLNQ